jgi:DNA-binding FadR family transcriptional regulator
MLISHLLVYLYDKLERIMKQMQPIGQRTIHAEIQARIKQYIIENKLKPGDALPTEAELVEQLDVSRGVVREGLRSLESLGVITSRQGEGRFVASFTMDPIMRNLGYSMLSDLKDVRDILEIRERLEISFMGDVIEAMDQATLERLRAIVADMRARATVGQAIMRWDLEFHRNMFSVVGNPLLLKLLDVFWQVYRSLCGESLAILDDPMTEIDKHEAVLAAVEARDAELARRRLAEHFDNVNMRLLSADDGEARQDAAPGRGRGEAKEAIG